VKATVVLAGDDPSCRALVERTERAVRWLRIACSSHDLPDTIEAATRDHPFAAASELAQRHARTSTWAFGRFGSQRYQSLTVW
jgi:5,10-methylene-tetrahydrofolate dehydrogenase/methenyl tetrahydrofolate cyclohydrolase